METSRPLARNLAGERQPVGQPTTPEEKFFGMDAESSVTVKAGDLLKAASAGAAEAAANASEVLPDAPHASVAREAVSPEALVAQQAQETAARELAGFTARIEVAVRELEALQTQRAALDAALDAKTNGLKALRSAAAEKARAAGMPETPMAGMAQA